MKNKSASIIIGILLVIAGIGYIGNVFEVWNFSIFFPGWWTLFIIIPAAVQIARNGFRIIYAVWLSVGGLLLISRLGVFPAVIIQLVFPALVLCIGLIFIFRGKLNGIVRGGGNDGEKHGNSNIKSYFAVFSGRSPNYNGKHFGGAYATAIFGGVDLKLAQADIADGAVIDALAVFGGIDIKVPPEVNIEISCIPLFGGISEPKNRVHCDAYPTLHVNAICVFGGVDIK